MQEEVNIKEMKTVDLKALAFDIGIQVDQGNANLREIYAELNQRQQNDIVSEKEIEKKSKK